MPARRGANAHPLPMPTVPPSLRAILLAAPAFAAGCVPVPSPVPVVETEQGRVAGAQSRGLAVFLGIPYAAPPVGPLRWREPQPPVPWDGVRSARAFGPACPQPADAAIPWPPTGPQDEDCLTLNVWSPALEPGARLPVLVWLHGGAFRGGGCSNPVRDGGALARRGLVVVSAQYRVGPFGFFAHPALERQRPRGPVNFGLLDQVAALLWVRRNIARFGGDPERVTLGGDDAGATSALCLLGASQAQGLFQRAILHSPQAWFEPQDRAAALTLGERLVQDAGLPAGATAAQLRELPAERLAALAIREPAFGPVRDGHSVLQSPRELALAQRTPRVPLLLGSTGDEDGLVAAWGTDAAAMLKGLGAGRAAAEALYGTGDDAALVRQLAADRLVGAPARWLAGAHSALAPVWLWHLALQTSARHRGAPGPAHGDDVPVVFGTAARAAGWSGAVGPADRWLADAVGAYWSAFAAAGRPASATGPDWPPYEAEGGPTFVFDAVLRIEHGYRSRRYDPLLPRANGRPGAR
jgi:para-nitrobenzyl esterase